MSANQIGNCCHVEEVSGVQCGNEAEWQIWYGPNSDDYTESCTRHVGEILTDAPEHRIYPIIQVASTRGAAK